MLTFFLHQQQISEVAIYNYILSGKSSTKIIGYALLVAVIIFGIWVIYKIIKAIVIHIKKKRGTYVEKIEENSEVSPDEARASDNEESNTADDETVAEEKSSN